VVGDADGTAVVGVGDAVGNGDGAGGLLGDRAGGGTTTVGITGDGDAGLAGATPRTDTTGTDEAAGGSAATRVAAFAAVCAKKFPEPAATSNGSDPTCAAVIVGANGSAAVPPGGWGVGAPASGVAVAAPGATGAPGVTGDGPAAARVPAATATARNPAAATPATALCRTTHGRGASGGAGTHHRQPWGAGGQAGSGLQPTGGIHGGCGVFHPGGALKTVRYMRSPPADRLRRQSKARRQAPQRVHLTAR
jgi:hypothetical protein